MIFLKDGHLIVETLIKKQLADEDPKDFESKLCDFEGVSYLLTGTSDLIFTLSVNIPTFDDLEAKYQVSTMVATMYGALVVTPVLGFHVTLQVDMGKIADESARLQTLSAVTELKRNIMSCPIRYIRNKMVNGEATDSEIVEVKVRGNASIFLKPHEGALHVFYNIKFRDSADVVYADVFLREFEAVRRTVGAAPSVTHRRDVPGVLESLNPETGELVHWVTLVLFPNHLKSKDVEKNISLLLGFRDYLQYHIKCSKAHLHTRMRTRVSEFLKVLNRARPDYGQKRRR